MKTDKLDNSTSDINCKVVITMPKYSEIEHESANIKLGRKLHE